MPTLKGITVHVTDGDGVPLVEYGNRKLERKGDASCYIQSERGMAFRVLMKPSEMPWPGFADSMPENAAELAQSLQLEGVADEDIGETLRLRRPDAPYHLLASLRLDGKRSVEKRMVIYLDERCPYYNDPDGVNFMNHRLLQDADGVVRECGWYFTDIGIDTVLEGLSLSKDAAAAKDTSDDLAAAFHELGANSLDDAEEKTSKGQIEISLVKVKLDRYEKKAAFRKEEVDDTDEDVDMDAQDASKVSHLAARNEGKRTDGRHDVIYYSEIPNEPVYATFKFYYRGEDKLRSLGFAVGHKAEGKTKGKQKRKDALSYMAPLSITAPVQKSKANFGGLKSAKELLCEEEGDDVRGRSRWRPAHQDRRTPATRPNSVASSASDKDSMNAEAADTDHEVEDDDGDERSNWRPEHHILDGLEDLVQRKARGASSADSEFDGDDEKSDADSDEDEDEDEDDDNDGVAQNQDDKGIGKRLYNVALGKRSAGEVKDNAERDVSPNSKAKKTKRGDADGADESESPGIGNRGSDVAVEEATGDAFRAIGQAIANAKRGDESAQDEQKAGGTGGTADLAFYKEPVDCTKVTSASTPGEMDEELSDL